MKSWAHKGIGVLAVFVGCLWTWGTLFEPLPGVSTNFDWSFYIISLAPGFLAIFYGVKVFKTPNNTNVTRSVGVLLFFVLALLPREVTQWVDESYRSAAYNSAQVLIALALMPIYVWISSAIMRWNGINAKSLRDYFGKPFALLLSFCVWGAVTAIIDIFYPMTELDPGKILLVSIVRFVPLLVAIVFYKLFVNWVGIDNVRPQSTEIRQA